MNMKDGYSPMIIICGKQRVGKSFVGVMISDIIMKAFSKKLNIKKQCFYEPYDVIKSLANKDTETRMIDESGAMLGRRQWWEQTHSALEKIIQTQGYKTMCYIFVSPFVQDIDKIFTKHFDYIIHVTRRGRYKAWKTKKLYSAISGKPAVSYFLDDISFNKKDIDLKVWQEYEDFSMEQKEKLRIKYDRMNVKNKSNKWDKFIYN